MEHADIKRRVPTPTVRQRGIAEGAFCILMLTGILIQIPGYLKSLNYAQVLETKCYLINETKNTSQNSYCYSEALIRDSNNTTKYIHSIVTGHDLCLMLSRSGQSKCYVVYETQSNKVLFSFSYRYSAIIKVYIERVITMTFLAALSVCLAVLSVRDIRADITATSLCCSCDSPTRGERMPLLQQHRGRQVVINIYNPSING